MADIQGSGLTETSTSNEIEATRTEIEHTRGNMAETLNAIKDKLDPKALMDQAKDTVGEVTTNLADKAKTTVHSLVEDVSSHAKEAAHSAVTGAVSGAVDEAKDVVGNAIHSAKDAVGNAVHSAQDTVGEAMDSAKGASSSVMDAIKRNPIPSALIALGATWLFMRKRDEDPRSSYRGASYQGEFDYYRPDQSGSGRSFVDQGKDMLGDAADAVSDAAHTVTDKAGAMVGSAKDAVGGAVGSAKDAGLTIIDTIERNPIPAAATALGIAWLYLKNQDENKAHRYTLESERYRRSNRKDDTSGVHDMVNSVKEKAGQVGDMVGSAMDSARDTAGQVSDSVGHAVDSAKSKVGQVTHDALDRAGDLSDRAMQQTRETGGAIMRTLKANPLPVGMVALGIGAAIGLLTPETERENQWMGEVRDRFVDKATDTAQDLAAKVKTVAVETLDAAQETAQHAARGQGLNLDGGTKKPDIGTDRVPWSEPKSGGS